MNDPNKGAVVLIETETLGRGDDDLGIALMGAFLKNLAKADRLPRKMIFMNGGAKLTTEGSPHLHSLKFLEERGVELLTCGTCLDWFKLRDSLAVGRPTTMHETVETLLASGGIIRP